jgi:DNA-binding NtrC family response regulator
MKDGKSPDQDSILIVEDDQALRSVLQEELFDAGYSVTATGDAENAWQILKDNTIDLVISDLRLPDSSGLEILLQSRRLDSTPGFIMITAFGTVEQAVDALKKGADDFLTKPLKLDHLRISVSRVLNTRHLQEEVSRYRKLITDNDFHGMVGNSKIMLELFDVIRVVAHADGPVLVNGESGTGKELVARAIHNESVRKSGPFIAVNCAGIPPDLLESELFGHTATAFTGAKQARKGLFAEADGGSILLDEIGEMPAEMQAKLLRILQDGRIRPIGSDKEFQLDVRIIAATNRILEDEVKQNRFREDLYFRLETFAIEVPALRTRSEDIELLTAHFINYFNLKLQRDVRGITPDALEKIKTHTFPGNVRELASSIERAVTFCRKDEIDITDLPDRIRNCDSNKLQLKNLYFQEMMPDNNSLPTLQEFEQQYIDYVLNYLNGNKRKAAEVLDIGRRTLYRRLDEASDQNRN